MQCYPIQIRPRIPDQYFIAHSQKPKEDLLRDVIHVRRPLDVP